MYAVSVKRSRKKTGPDLWCRHMWMNLGMSWNGMCGWIGLRVGFVSFPHGPRLIMRFEECRYKLHI